MKTVGVPTLYVQETPKRRLFRGVHAVALKAPSRQFFEHYSIFLCVILNFKVLFIFEFNKRDLRYHDISVFSSFDTKTLCIDYHNLACSSCVKLNILFYSAKL